MQAVILAGGLGSRLQPLTDKIPKSMISVLGRPFLEYELKMLKHYGIRNIILSIGYLGEQIKNYFSDGSQIGLNIKYSIEEKPMGTGGGIKLASSLLKDEFFVVYGDSYLPIDYRQVMTFFKASGKIGAMVVYDNKYGDTTVPCNISIDKNMLVRKYEKNSADKNLHLVEAGVLAFNKTLLNFIPDKKIVSLEEEILPILIKQREIMGFVTSQKFYDIGLPNRLREFEEYIRNDYFQNTV